MKQFNLNTHFKTLIYARALESFQKKVSGFSIR